MGRYQVGLFGGQGGVEQVEGFLGAHRGQAAAGHPGQIGGIEVCGHGAGLFPQTPGQRHRGQSGGAPMGGQRVEEGVGRRVVGLPGGAHRGRYRGKHHKRR